MLLGSPDPPNVGHVSVKHRLILTGGYARISVRGQVSRGTPVRAIGGPGQTYAPAGMSSIVRKCNVFGVKKACVWRVNPGVDEPDLVPVQSLLLMRPTLFGRLISSSIRCGAGHQ